MSYSLNSLKGGYIGIKWGSIIGDIKGDTRSLDYGSYNIIPYALRRTSKIREFPLIRFLFGAPMF